MHVFGKAWRTEKKDVNFIGIDISEDILGVARRNMEAEFGEGSRGKRKSSFL